MELNEKREVFIWKKKLNVDFGWSLLSFILLELKPTLTKHIYVIYWLCKV